MIRKIVFGGIIAMVAITTSCSKDDDDDPIVPIVTNPTTQDIRLNITGLEDLGANFVYEAFLLTNSDPISLGTFTVDATGTLSTTTFTANIADADAAVQFGITVEPVNDSDPSPSESILLIGEFNGTNVANLWTGGPAAVGDFSASAGTLFLRTPTDETGTNNGNDTNGVWFGLPGMPPTEGLTLPTLPNGWVYEGWVIGDAGPITTGTFTAFNTADSGNPFSGMQNNAGPPIPGEDFFLNAPTGETFPLNVRGRRVVISVEPSPDNSPAPFLLKPLLIDLSTTAATAPTTHNFGQNLGSLPTGTATK